MANKQQKIPPVHVITDMPLQIALRALYGCSGVLYDGTLSTGIGNIDDIDVNDRTQHQT